MRSEAKASHQQAVDELETKQELQRRNPGNIARRDIEKLELLVESRLGAIAAANATNGGADLDPSPGGKGKRPGGARAGRS